MFWYILTFFLALLAVITEVLDWKGALSGIMLAYILLFKQNAYWLSILLTFFIVGSLATKIKASKKKKYGLYQKIRSTENVLANGSIAVLMALYGNFYGFLGALSTATADTLSSELGVLSKTNPRLITNFKKVKAGTNGGVSVLGTFFAFLGAILIGFSGFLILGNYKIMLLCFLSGVFGCFIDSYVGATLEKNWLFKNWTTNLVATTAGAVSAISIANML